MDLGFLARAARQTFAGNGTTFAAGQGARQYLPVGLFFATEVAPTEQGSICGSDFSREQAASALPE